MPVYLNRYRKLNGNMLKITACITMLLDHIGAAIIYPVNSAGLITDSRTFEHIKLIYDVLRWIGRTSFPIFCFLLVEGFFHTSSRLRYALSLLCFAFISEPFYDLAFDTGRGSCNVMFTLFLGLIALWLSEGTKIFLESRSFPPALSFLAGVSLAVPIIFFANYIHSDYHGYGVGLIFIFYLLSKYEPLNILAGYLFILAMPNEAASFPAFILMLFYSKKQGRKPGRLKYLFYAFYPVHLAVLYLIRYSICS